MSVLDNLKRLDNGHYVIYLVKFVTAEWHKRRYRTIRFTTLEDAQRCYGVMCEYYKIFDTLNGIAVEFKTIEKKLAVFDGTEFHLLDGKKLNIDHIFSGNLSTYTDDEIIDVIFGEPRKVMHAISMHLLRNQQL